MGFLPLQKRVTKCFPGFEATRYSYRSIGIHTNTQEYIGIDSWAFPASKLPGISIDPQEYIGIHRWAFPASKLPGIPIDP
jgi:hypothetical protein